MGLGDTMTTHFRARLPWIPLDGGPLGRNINHDPLNRAYPVTSRAAVRARANAPVSRDWPWKMPTLNQGKIGSCTGNGSVGQMGCDGPVYQALSSLLSSGALKLDEPEAVRIYTLATTLDPFPGSYPAEDTGSDGPSAAKACKQLGLISGYTHAFSIDDVIAGLQAGAGMVGTNWTTNMDSPDPKTGVISKPTGGKLRGGHEYCVSLIDLARGLLGFRQSWGQWGIVDPTTNMWGRFYMQVEDFADVLAQQGDATFFVALNEPAPTPQPVTDPVDAALVASGNAWEKSIFSEITKAGKFKASFDNWKKARGYV